MAQARRVTGLEEGRWTEGSPAQEVEGEVAASPRPTLMEHIRIFGKFKCGASGCRELINAFIMSFFEQ